MTDEKYKNKDLINLQDNELVYLDSFSFGLKLS